MNDISYLSMLTLQVGDLIHYKEHDLKESHPKSARLFSVIGSCLRKMTHEREEMTISELLNDSDSLSSALGSQNLESYLSKLMPMNSIALVDLVSRVEGNGYNIEDAIQSVYHLHKLKLQSN